MDRITTERSGALALDRIFGYEPATSRQIIDHFGSTAAIFSLSQDQIRDIFGPYGKHNHEITPQALERAQEELDRLCRQGYSLLSLTEEAYPQLLKDCPDAPAGLFVRSGTAAEALFNTGPAISIVGTRDISPYGQEWCHRIVQALSRSERKPVIVSGLAFGVDINAHMAAMENGLRTIAVLPTGIDEVYPKMHTRHASRIASSPGSAVITDYPPGTSPQAFTFLRRNRLIAGLSEATILIESKSRGGGLMTVRLANEYGRRVLALPGRIDDIRSAGCNRIIREMLAEPIVTLEDIAETLGLGKGCKNMHRNPAEVVLERYAPTLGEDEAGRMSELTAAIRSNRGVTTDELCRLTGQTFAAVSLRVGILQSDGFISIDLFQRCSINHGND